MRVISRYAAITAIGQPHTLELLQKLGAADSSSNSNSKVLTSVKRGMSPADVIALRPAFTAGSAAALEVSIRLFCKSL
jgi:hypothetical protein